MNTTFIYIIIMNIIGFCFVAAEGETIAGCILVGTDGRRGYIYHTAVHPELQRRGLGRDVRLPPQDAPLVFCRGHAADFGCADRASVVLFALNTQLSG